MSIIYSRVSEYILTGNNNISMPTYVEVKILSPFYGICLHRMPEETTEWSATEQQEFAEELLQKCYEIGVTILKQRTVIKKDFLQLLCTLKDMNNEKSQDYIRNRENLMGVFMRSHFPELVNEQPAEINYSNALYSFLSEFFMFKGKNAELDLQSEIITDVQPPAFAELENLLREYLSKPFEEKIFLMAQQAVSRRNGKYDWFLIQEFLTPEITIQRNSNPF